VGLFAIISTMVRQRRYELGIRMALGATSERVGAGVLLRGVSLGLVGTVIGIAGALAAGRLVSALLFDVSPVDVATLLSVAALMVLVAGIASVIPARLGMRVDPVIALRKDT
jgi:putative ABC transport system permease protein